ncbi:hypothetical protein PT276_04145 [Orbaceae bacterium ESL0721]|nr:hypothetical protein [Orbaceae bacterium ESL0721]
MVPIVHYYKVTSLKITVLKTTGFKITGLKIINLKIKKLEIVRLSPFPKIGLPLFIGDDPRFNKRSLLLLHPPLSYLSYPSEM